MIFGKNFVSKQKISYLCNPKNRYGSLAEGLGTGLQNRLRRFESATNLLKSLQSAEFQHLIARIFYIVFIAGKRGFQPDIFREGCAVTELF